MAELDHFTLLRPPKGKISHLLMAFRGWPDANEAATWTIRCLMRKLSAKKMAELDPEEFFDFGHVRPFIKLNKEGVRDLRWPSNELFYHNSTDSSQNFIFLLATEPSLKWRTYCDAILDLVMKSGVHTVIHLGSLMDAVPHTRPLRITGSATDPETLKTLASLAIHTSNYQAPSSISSAMMERCNVKGLKFITLWGHGPHYLQTAPNLKVTHGLVQAVCQLLDVKLDLQDLKTAAATFDDEIQKSVEKDSHLKTYVQKLEEQYDQDAAALAEMPDGEEMVREVEEFLKDQLGNGHQGSGGL